ncbi:MAG: low molecular weight protein-tyrosine-phosphatase [Candidatus Obscuribacterales bacterium]|nr:low molecular weight phosphotyrosine protein phosphatase [Cyanobacteria bacterium SZAS LIN-5]
MNVLFVCLGNICRSPMAEGILKQLYKERAITGNVESVGLMDWNADKAADYRAIAVARENGLDITSHRARQIRKDDFDRFDIILAMDGHNIRLLEKIASPEHKNKIRLLRGVGDIKDPYQGTEKDFREAFKLIKESIENLVEKY